MGFRVDGKVTQRLVDVGQRVKPGDVLARLDAVDYALSVRQAEAQLASAEKQVEISRLALNRAQILQEKNITSQSTLEQSQLTYDQAVSSRDAAKSSLEQAENRVAYTVLTADVAGIVTAANAEAGQVIAAGSPVVTVAQDGAKEAAIAVPEPILASSASARPCRWGSGHIPIWRWRARSAKSPEVPTASRVRLLCGSACRRIRPSCSA